MAYYRPFSQLTSFSKVVEVICKRILTDIINHNILVSEQFWMRSKLSPEKASCNLICEILKASNNKRIVWGFFLLRKGF